MVISYGDIDNTALAQEKRALAKNAIEVQYLLEQDDSEVLIQNILQFTQYIKGKNMEEKVNLLTWNCSSFSVCGSRRQQWA